MESTRVDGVGGSLHVEQFTCIGGVGLTIREAESTRATIRISERNARQFASDLVTRLGGVAIFGEPVAEGK